jgi:hypothetical protein
MLGDFSVLEAVCLLFGCEQLDVLAQRALIALEGEEIGLLVDDLPGDVALAAMASMVMIAPSSANISRSAGMATISLDLSVTLTWPSTKRWRAAKTDTTWIAAFPPLLWADLREVLPSMAITSVDTPISLATQATKRRWNSVASSVARMSPSWSCDGVPSRNGRNRRRSSIFFCRTARYRRRFPRPPALPAGTTKGSLEADRRPCRAAADLENPQKIPEEQVLPRKRRIPPSRPPQIRIRGSRQIQYFSRLSRTTSPDYPVPSSATPCPLEVRCYNAGSALWLRSLPASSISSV